MGRSWIQLRTRRSPYYINGVKEFIAFATNHMEPGTDTIFCPCNRCNNYNRRSPEQVEDHLYAYGMVMGYTKWVNHGEELRANDSDNDFDMVDAENELDDQLYEMLNELQSDTFAGDRQHHEDSYNYSSYDNCNFNKKEDKFDRVIRDAEQDLYPGCQKFSKLSFIVKLLHLKSLNGWSNNSFTMLLELLKDAFPIGNNLPTSYYQAKKVIKDLGLRYEKIHACSNDCVLFWEEYEDQQECPKCHTSRYVFDKDKKKNVARKILRHFPLVPRLKRLFISKKTAFDMRWHKDKRADDGVLRHPADSDVWKHFDQEHQPFAMDPRNVRLGLSSDGFNPFGNNNLYSMWPVFLVAYNLPPWKCMKDPFLMMSLLIPGPSSPGNNIDVYLQPLVKELKELWTNGINTYDAASGQYFSLRAALLWTIHDFPAYGNISGWSTRGKLACPTCNKETCSKYLRNWKKVVYLGHRRFLPQDHAWRRSKCFDGKPERRSKPKLLSGDEICEQLAHVIQPSFGKNPEGQKKRKRPDNYLNWTKVSIFFDLPYWKNLKLRHNLDVMHIEKNVCDSLLGTLMNIKGKTKDTYKTRLDLQEMKIRHELHPRVINGQTLIPIACYSFSLAQQKGFCEFIKSIKFPDGMASNISRCVSDENFQLFKMKSHDSHVMLQHLLPIALRGHLRKDVRTAIIELCLFFKELTSRTLKLEVLEQLNRNIALITCKLEKIFPPSFFDIMLHLPIHLAHEAMLAGPVQYRWMYPFERKMHNLKSFVKNKAHPEGSIAESYCDNECLTFCSMYFNDVETKFNRLERNDDSGYNKRSKSLYVFSHKFRCTGAPIDCELTLDDWKKIRWYVLNNCDEVYPYIMEHISELQMLNIVDIKKRHELEFHEWFLKRIQQLEAEGSVDLIDDLRNLSIGPDKAVTRYSGCNINGIRFHTQDHDRYRKTQNSGVIVRGEHGGKSIDFYGVLKDIIEISYLGGNQVIVFKCDWWDLSNTRGTQIDEYKFISVNINKTWYNDDPFVLACQSQQVYYLSDTRFGSNWRVVQRSQPRCNYNVLEEVYETESNKDDDDPYQQESHDITNFVENDDTDDDDEVLLHNDDMSMVAINVDVETQKSSNCSTVNDGYDANDDAFINDGTEEDYTSSENDDDFI